MNETTAIVKSLADKMRETGDAMQYRIHQLMMEPGKHCTDLGNAMRLVKKYGDIIRYCDELGKWLIWDGRRWAIDKSQRIRTLAFETVRDIYREAAETVSESERVELANWAIKSESATRINAMLSLAEAMVSVTVDELDADPWLFNVANGTLDLRTGELLPHDPARLITKISDVAFDQEAECPTWIAFLERIMDGNRNLITFLQYAAGYSMVGEVSEHVLIFLYGTGANGKSTFLDALLHVFGDYGQPTDPELLLAKRGEVHPTGVADLRGARLAVTNEIEDGRRLAENLVKQLTGGDRLKARFMHRDFFEFKPSHTLWMAGNHKPIIRGQDEGIWRRIRLVPFNVTIPEHERDPHLKDKLKAEAPGILKWALEGCLKWQAKGLSFPDEVRVAVAEYREESDPLADFFEEECVIHDNAQVKFSDLYSAYTRWCEQNGVYPFSQMRLASLIEQKFPNARKKKTKNGRIWFGIGLKYHHEHTSGDGVTTGDGFSEKHAIYNSKANFTENPSPPVTRHPSPEWDQWEMGEV